MTTLPTAGPRGDLDAAFELLATGPLVVLTGAGLSTDSGIPDYRGPGSVPRQPMTYGEFVSGPAARRRYWARSHVGWSRLSRATPNAGHRALAALDPALLITQNVDGLHEQAGSRELVALHGRVAEVVCLQCHARSDRAGLQRRMSEANPGWLDAHAEVAARPDGDVELEDTDEFVVPGCLACGGVLKPHVVFFGENVPKQRVERCYRAVDALQTTGGTLLVVGSSLAVMSGLRFVKRAARDQTPVVIINRGATRGDPLATYRLETGSSETLQRLVQRRLRPG